MIDDIQHPPLEALLTAGSDAFSQIDAPEAPQPGAFSDEEWDDLEDIDAARTEAFGENDDAE